MPSNHLILCCPLLLLPSIFPSIRVFSNESALHIRWPKYWSFSFNISPSSEHSGLISFRMDWLDLLAVQGTLKKSLLQHHSSKASHYTHQGSFPSEDWLLHIYQHTAGTGESEHQRILPSGHEAQLLLSFSNYVLLILNSFNTKAKADQWHIILTHSKEVWECLRIMVIFLFFFKKNIAHTFKSNASK